MAPKIAPPKSTAGGGGIFENQVCAWLLALMLADEPPLEPELGCLARLDFQVRPDGWYPDDVLLKLVMVVDTHYCALSIKSNAQFTSKNAPKDFVRLVWEQFLHVGTDKFDESNDFMGIVTGPLPSETRTALSCCNTKAIFCDPNLLQQRYAQAGWASESDIFKSFHCPPNLAERFGITEADTGRLLARLRFLEFDFESTPSKSKNAAVSICRRVLKSGQLEEAIKLWAFLCCILDQYRPQGGSITRVTLLDMLRNRFELVDRPDYRSDWERLKNLTRASASLVSDLIGGKVKLPRDKETEQLNEALKEKRRVVLLGASGVGKSTVVRRYVEKHLDMGERCLWFEERSFEDVSFAAFQASLQLNHSLMDVVRDIPDSRAVLVLDGLDRLHDNNVFDLLAAFLKLFDIDRPESPWRVVLTCQTVEWARIKKNLARAGVAPEKWYSIECWPISNEDLKPVWEQIPRSSKLKDQLNLAPLLFNLKILDLVALHLICGDEVSTPEWVGESSVATWFWETQIEQRPDGIARSQSLALLAQRQADLLRSITPHDLDPSELAPLRGLMTDHVIRLIDNKIIFEHDLFGDWARLQLLSARSASLHEFMKDRLDSPLWHRAVRLFGIYLLEHTGDSEKWRTVLSSVDDDYLIQDLLLESTLFAADPLSLLERIRSDLLQNSSRLLRRLLGRFLAFATTPCWPPMLHFLYKYRNEVMQAAPHEVARIIVLWLNGTPKGHILRPEAAEMGLSLGERTLCEQEARDFSENAQSELFYRAALAGAEELPDKVADFALRASARAIREERDEDEGPLDPMLLSRTLSCDPRFDPNEPLPEPWPDGPLAFVDERFCNVVLEEKALTPLIRVRPAAAREVVLAVLIKARRKFEWHDRGYNDQDLDLNDVHRWSPPLYVDGPFLDFLQENFSEGLDLIMRLVNFATERWYYYAEEDARQYEAEAGGGNNTGGSLMALLNNGRHHPGKLEITIGEKARHLLGDERVYGWSSGGPPAPPSTIVAALMALEQYFYLAIDKGEDVEDKVQTVLERAKSVAFFKVLCDVGGYSPALFEGPLKPLLAIPEIYFWDAIAHGRIKNHPMIGTRLRNAVFRSRAKRFFEMKHRDHDMRQHAVWMFIKLNFNQSPSLTFFEEARRSWETRLEGTLTEPLREFIQNLIVSFRIENYAIEKHLESGFILINERARKLEEEKAGERRSTEEDRLLISFPGWCAQLFEEGKGLEHEQLEFFWGTAQRIDAMELAGSQPESSLTEGEAERARNIIDSLAGAVAVLIRFHFNWLTEHPERLKWCCDCLRDIILTPPSQRDYDGPESMVTWTWDCFAAQALPLLWAKDPRDLELRLLISRLLFAPHYTAVAALFRQCSEFRIVLGVARH